MLLLRVTNPDGPCSSIVGSASGFGTPKFPNDGPIPRTSTCLGALPVTMNPPIPTWSPVRINIRVDRLSACAAAGALGVGVGVGLITGVPVEVAVAVAVAVGVATGVPVEVAVAVAVAVGVGLGVPGVGVAQVVG